MPLRLPIIVLAAVLMGASSPAWAQEAAAPATPPAAAATQEPYTYAQDGRRDPFVSLLARGTEAVLTSQGSGLAGIPTAELMLRGVIESRGSFVALVSGPDGKTHRAHVNDAVADGVIRTVTPQGIVIMQNVSDPLSLVKQREVRKGLRTVEDGK